MYFDQPGKVNTEQTLQAAFHRAEELGLNEVVVATSSGQTAFKALEIFKDYTVVAVTYHCGFSAPFKKRLPDEVRTELESKGAKVVMATHALSGVERSLSQKFGGAMPVLIVADTLRLFGQGTKVAVEISVMAADAGVLSGKDIMAVGGTAKGADTALVLKPANQSDLFELRIRETVCKPRQF